MRKSADGTEVTMGGHGEISLVFQKKFADSCISQDFAGRAWLLFLEKDTDDSEYPMQDQQNRVKGYRNSPVASEGV